jgi:23S rRNA (pseudouridine1915-N3)-methyltransferase
MAIGRMGRGPEADLFERYATRLRPSLAVTELAEGRGSAGEIKRREGEALLAGLPANSFLVALDLGAKPIDSPAFSALTTKWLEMARPIVFAIGGAEGFDGPVLARADHILSLGVLTWPHMLVRVMLAEQLYRARAIATGHPYHRSGRPTP